MGLAWHGGLAIVTLMAVIYAATGAWATYPKLEDLFTYNGSGVMPGRTWIIAPDSESLERRWQKLTNTPASEKEVLFHPHGQGDRHSKRVVHDGLPGYEARPTPVSDEHGECAPPVLYGFRSFDRQWIIPDNRVVNRPNPELWRVRSNHQIFITAPSDRSPTNGPALTMTAVIPDLHHYNGRGGRVLPLWSDADASSPNLPPKLLPFLAQRLSRAVSAEDVVAYVAAVAAHPAFTARFHDDLATPGLRLPITADADAFSSKPSRSGATVIWLHTFGERMADPDQGRPAQPPRLAAKRRPSIPKDGAISRISDAMPNSIDYDEHTQRLLIGTGYVENVPPAVWCYEVSGKRVLVHWFSYRKRDRTRPIIGDRRPPSPLGNIQPDHWLAAYTTELINVLNVLGWLVEIEPQQAALLEQICAGPTIRYRRTPSRRGSGVSSDHETVEGRQGIACTIRLMRVVASSTLDGRSSPGLVCPTVSYDAVFFLPADLADALFFAALVPDPGFFFDALVRDPGFLCAAAARILVAFLLGSFLRRRVRREALSPSKTASVSRSIPKTDDMSSVFKRRRRPLFLVVGTSVTAAAIQLGGLDAPQREEHLGLMIKARSDAVEDRRHVLAHGRPVGARAAQGDALWGGKESFALAGHDLHHTA